MFNIILGRSNSGKTTTLNRLIETSTKKHISINYADTKTNLCDLINKYIADDYIEFFIDEFELFQWGETKFSSYNKQINHCLCELEKMADDYKIDIFVTMQKSRSRIN